MRCPQCASDNPADYRFCGMCGTPLEKTPEPVTRSTGGKREEPVAVPAERASRVERFTPSSRSNGGSSLLGLNDPPPRPPGREKESPRAHADRVEHERRSVEQETRDWAAPQERVASLPPESSTISGPSFLGLSGPAHGGHADHSRDLTYLFDEDEQPRRSYGRFIGILLVLAILGGLGYLQYKRSGASWTPPWAKGPARTPVQASQQQPGKQNASPTPGADAGAAPAAPNGNQPPNATDRPQEGSVKEQDLPPQGSTAQGEQGAGSTEAEQTATPGASEPAKGDTAVNKGDTTDTASAGSPPVAKNATNGPPSKGVADAAKSVGTKESGEGTDTKEIAGAKGSRSAEANDREEAADVPAKPARSKPSPQVASPDDTLVTNAEKYLYGRGVPQNCDRALISLRAAANRQNPRAMTLLGTMYGTGHCVSRDLPNSYRWFAQASRQSPDNTWINRNLEMIWREMTPAERQLATARQ